MSISNTQAFCIHQLFESQVEKTPEKIAVIFKGEKLTYQQLNCKANQLAHYLQTLGVGPDVLVGICLERSLEMVIGLLGILKAGGAYVPLDPAYPQQRLALMLGDAQVSVVLTQNTLLQMVSDCLMVSEPTVVCLDNDWDKIDQQSSSNPVSGVMPNSLAYTIYTSGSTGKPKGVQIEHHSVINFLNSMSREPGMTADDVLLGVTTISFDIAALEIYLPLSLGAKVVLVSREVAADPQQLIEHLTLSGATVMQATPATWQMLLAGGWQGNKQLKILCGGEALSQKLAASLLASCDSLWNLYGPTETTIWSMIYKVESAEAAIPLGHPIDNTQIYLLDPDLRPQTNPIATVPVGVPGELYIGGFGVARGYLNRPDLTNEKFIADPFSDISGARLYKTGDLARYLPDGSIEFIGRTDHQVKIRGFRIELKEIEAILVQHPSVQQTVVMAREDVPGDTRLVAYVVPNQEKSCTTNELRQFLKEKLPNHMIPSAFAILDTFPLTPNGKVDRRALPVPNQVRQELEETYVAPQDELEQKLSQIWQQVLGVQPIGIRDNFFELGGNSLLAVKVFWQIEKTFGKNLPLATLIQSGTVEALANIIREPEKSSTMTDLSLSPDSGATEEVQKLSTSWSLLVPIQAEGSLAPLFCIHDISGDILNFLNLARYLGSERPIYGLQAKGLDGQQSPYTRIEDMASRYIKEIQTLQPKGPYFLCGYSFGGVIAFEMAQQLHRQGEKVAKLFLLDTYAPGAINRLPLLKRIPLHWNHLLEGRTAYIWKRVKGWSDWLQRIFQYRTEKIACKFYLSLRLPLPRKLRYSVMEDIHNEARAKYNLQVYPGRVTVLAIEEEQWLAAEGYELAPNLGWDKLAGEGVDIHYTAGTHHTILAEPHVQVLAAKLKACLAQTAEEQKLVEDNQLRRLGSHSHAGVSPVE
ncbi:amino acid adenylation domain-containing protein [Scytonema sp. UIC 10036]|uniref:non-ribosomal peptide synthetase n=1 Tax=Scytonema sp. UIC 10036 TaxID=2304196 RepID=UPI0012DA2D74|nr:amino acid adenylation domain-containing protein [Scytonema sp. UIC 10036]MUG99157.1 amino acid adenylation domain-containing protein [Scytonema sp. UIC 10036]